MQFVFKRQSTDSTLVVDASKTLNALEKEIFKMMVASAQLKKASPPALTESQEREVEVCKEVFYKRLRAEAEKQLELAGKDWDFEDIIKGDL